MKTDVRTQKGWLYLRESAVGGEYAICEVDEKNRTIDNCIWFSGIDNAVRGAKEILETFEKWRH